MGLNLLYYIVIPVFRQKWKAWKSQRDAARNEAAIEQAVQEEYEEILSEIKAKSDRVYVIRKEKAKYDPKKYDQELTNG